MQASFCKMTEMPCSVVDCYFTQKMSLVLTLFTAHSRLFSYCRFRWKI